MAYSSSSDSFSVTPCVSRVHQVHDDQHFQFVSYEAELDRIRLEMEAKVRAEIEAKQAEEDIIRWDDFSSNDLDLLLEDPELDREQWIEIRKVLKDRKAIQLRMAKEAEEKKAQLKVKNYAKIPKIIEYLRNASKPTSGGTPTFPDQHDKVTTALTKWMDTLESEYICSHAIWARSADNGTENINSNTHLITDMGIYRMYFSVTNTVLPYDVSIQHIYQFETSLSGTIMEKMFLSYPPTYIWCSNVIGNMPDTTWSDATPRFLSLIHAIPGTKIA